MNAHQKLSYVIDALLDELELSIDEENHLVRLPAFAENKPITQYELSRILVKLEKESCVKLFLRNRDTFDRNLLFAPDSRKKIYIRPLRAGLGKVKESSKADAEDEGTIRFHDGVLYRDLINNVIKFDENSMQYNLLSVAFSLPIETRIDCTTDGIDMKNFRQLYDAARSINAKARDQLRVESDIFSWAYGDQYIQRML